MAAAGLLVALVCEWDSAMVEHNMTYQLTHLLCEHGLLNTEQAQEAEQLAITNDLPLVSCLVRNRFLSSETILETCRQHFKLSVADLGVFDTGILHDGTIDPELINRHHILPLTKDQHSIQIAISDPTNHAAICAMRFHTGLRVHMLLANETDLDRMIHTHCRPNLLYSQLQSALTRMQSITQNDVQPEESHTSDEPVIEFVNQLLQDAISKEVSDIHIETFATVCRMRFRRDGLLYEAAILPPALALRVITRLKIMSNLDISEKRMPQDGRFSFQHQHHTDIRASTCPGLHGENIVLRILRHHAQHLPLEMLGMSPPQLTHFQKALSLPQGLILVTGPTGSGKTVTLYSALQQLNQPENNIMTVEDPVEIELSGVKQINVNPRIGLDFARLLRSVLRQDPDVIMIGEIRDAETAASAIQAAQTGHLVLSTLHTNSAIDTIKRLLALQVAQCHLAGSLKLIVAQRLIRQLCQHCRPQEDEALPKGCESWRI